jgi:sugar phosphate isomerase/epimerase
MDYFGCSLWSEIMMNNKDWNSSLNLPLDEDGEFVPDRNGWDIIFKRLFEFIEDAGLKGKLGGCYHTSSEIPTVLNNFGLVSDYKDSLQKYNKENNIEIGMHSTFGRNDQVCNGNYVNVLKKDLELCTILAGSCIVEHSSIPKKNADIHLKQMVDELTSDQIVELLLKYPNISLSWENMGNKKSQFSSLNRLVDLIDALGDKLKDIGHPEMIKQHNLCLDTGHLLIAMNQSKEIKKEIVDSLPRFAKKLKVFHIHANNGKNDNHIIPSSLEFFNLPNRKGIKEKKFLQNSEIVWEWLQICNENKGMDGRHIHLEALRMPFSLTQVTEFGQRYGKDILGL